MILLFLELFLYMRVLLDVWALEDVIQIKIRAYIWVLEVVYSDVLASGLPAYREKKLYLPPWKILSCNVLSGTAQISAIT